MKKKTKIINVDFNPDKKLTSERAHQLTKEKKERTKKTNDYPAIRVETVAEYNARQEKT